MLRPKMLYLFGGAQPHLFERRHAVLEQLVGRATLLAPLERTHRAQTEREGPTTGQ